ncbi:hypothetical protein [Luteibaculum oceani]|uniref:Uncharacterized protein n=1 Tax=Luteibaculum oceani TaxID=1294296 RepID=A0A5C6VFF5_9FLAO|nr:hypothetical protein [Luteibaculum oceani]TXC82048.1 hypothetical protein FRX97_02850 [Luteibaculum oceani]
MRPIYYILLIILSSTALVSCKLDKEEPIPGFIRIDTLQNDLNYSSQGTNRHNFTEAWVYIDGGLLGVYDLPALFPVLETGTRDVMIRPGIKRDGISASRVNHPHFENWEVVNTEIRIGDTLELVPQLQLRSGINVWFEDFEEAGMKFENAGTADTSLTPTTDSSMVYEGNGSGYAFLDGDNDRFAIFTKENFNFRYGTPVFLEFDYKIEGFLQISILVHTPGQPDVGKLALFVGPKYNDKNQLVWNKIYVNLSDEISSEPNASSFDIRIEGFPNFDQTNTSYLIDNVKVLYPN